MAALAASAPYPFQGELVSWFNDKHHSEARQERLRLPCCRGPKTAGRECCSAKAKLVSPSNMGLSVVAPSGHFTPSFPLRGVAVDCSVVDSPETVQHGGDGEPSVAEVAEQEDMEPAEQKVVKEVDPQRVYVGGIAFNFQGQELRKALHKLFSQFGPVKEIEIASFATDNTFIQQTGRHRGFGFVVMEDPEDAQAAVTCLNGQSYWGRDLMVRLAYKKVAQTPPVPEHPCQLYVGNLDKTMTNRDLMKIFRQHGRVLQAKIIKEYITGKSRGFGFVTFAEEEDGQRAAQALDGVTLAGSKITVNIAKEPRFS